MMGISPTGALLRRIRGGALAGRLDGKVALIAGAGGEMGSAVPALFAREGAKVIVSARRAHRLQGVVDGIRNAGGEADLVSADFTTASGAEEAVGFTELTFGRVDVVYNNLGDSAARGQKLHETHETDWEYLLRINLTPAYVLTRAAVPALRRSGGGVIIHVAASADIRARAHAGYAAAKEGLIALTANSARSYRSENIRVVCLSPHAMTGSHDGDVALPRLTLDRAGTASDVAWAALFLASQESAWISGIDLPINGGQA
jgi:NAD(P)-dependent dehydrogenase (short-subunit alcohol dehydrogenase family)